MNEEDKPVTKGFLESKLKLFRSELELERSERQLRITRYVAVVLAVGLNLGLIIYTICTK